MPRFSWRVSVDRKQVFKYPDRVHSRRCECCAVKKLFKVNKQPKITQLFSYFSDKENREAFDWLLSFQKRLLGRRLKRIEKKSKKQKRKRRLLNSSFDGGASVSEFTIPASRIDFVFDAVYGSGLRKEYKKIKEEEEESLTRSQSSSSSSSSCR